MKRILLLLTAWTLMLGYTSPLAAQSATGNFYEAFIQVNSNIKDYLLEAAGVTITAKYDGFYTARIQQGVTPQTLTAIDGVEYISPALTLVTCCDSVRYFSHVDDVHQGYRLDMPYTGSGVIVGVIDCGFDFNHINLCDAYGSPRVKAVYMPLDESGTRPVVNHRLLPGSCYETPSQIIALTTDQATTTHGTQTAGIAAGGYKANGWHGIAPDADLVLCGMPEDELTDVRVANCISYINDYANRKGKPCVINISLGTNVGPHDGTSYLNRVFEQFSAPGRVVVVSAGNDGDSPVTMQRDIQGREDTVTTLLSGYGGGTTYAGSVNAWAQVGKPFNTRMVVVNRHNGQTLYRSRAMGATSASVSATFTTDNDSILAEYCVGSVKIQSVINADGRPSSLCDLNIRTRSANYVIGFQYYTPLTTRLKVWTSQYAFIKNYDFPWAETGVASGSISDLAATDSVISVGSYNSRQTVPLRDGGEPYFRPNSTPLEISYFSAYGPDENGIQRPDVCAPGSVVVASANRYDTEAPNLKYWQPSAFVDDVEYPYCPDLGTSMSAPVVTGAVALWMQANPNLSTAGVRDVLRNTSYRDFQVMSGDPARWGSGKLDVYEGMRYILHIEAKNGDVNGDGEISLGDINTVIEIILGRKVDDDTRRRADVNNDGEISISDINAVIELIMHS